jgi:hypothetical protein
LPRLPPDDDDVGLAPDEALLTAPEPARTAAAGPLCPVDRLSRRRRNQICIIVIVLGLLNYLAYTLTYAALGGDAQNGYRTLVVDASGARTWAYYVRGHFIHSLTGREREVSRGAWIYSYLHSISVPLTSGAMLISMLVLARPHILATMRGGWFSGQTFVVAFGTVVILASVAVAVMFLWNFVDALAGTA